MKPKQSIQQKNKYDNIISEIDPKAGDMQVANEALHNAVLKQLLDEKVVTTADKMKLAKLKLKGGRMSKNSIDATDFIQTGKITWEDIGKLQNHHNLPQWAKEIETYCSNNGILPEDLILAHQEAQGRLKKSKLTKDAEKKQKDSSKPVISQRDHSKWNEDYRKRKLGISE